MAPSRHKHKAPRSLLAKKHTGRVPFKHAHISKNRNIPQPVKMACSTEGRVVSTNMQIRTGDDMCYQTPNMSITVELCHPNKSEFVRGKPFLEECFNLIESTSGADYRASSIGWHPVEKMREMEDRSMLYLLCRSADFAMTPAEKEDFQLDKIHGFLSFMFTNDDPPHTDREVVYIYEVHLEKDLRGLGLGKRLIKIAESAAKEMGVSKTMLTVFSSNKDAIGMYEKLGYTKDTCSPPARKTRTRVIEADYIIMSKELELE